MPRSPLFGRRIHIAGSIPAELSHAPSADVVAARELIAALTTELIARGATVVVPVDKENLRQADNQPICFDWLIWETIRSNLHRRPSGAPSPLAIAVQHHKTEEQIPPEFHGLWDALRSSDLVKIENAAHWNMGSKRMEVQARWGDILIALGGSEGVYFLANLYLDAGKPVVPLNLPICAAGTGARRLFDYGLSSLNTPRLFRTGEGPDPHGWINRINFPSRRSVTEKVTEIVALLEALEPPTAFGVRLLNPEHEDFAAVEDYFATVVKPIVEDELGYKLVVVDGKQPFDAPRIDQEIFAKLHRSAVIIADITASRPNCFLELGYALGRSLPVMVLARKDTKHPFDIETLAGHHWTSTGSVDERRRLFREHWAAIRNRPPLVPMEPLIP
ncbi:MAG: hypothetical protein WC807_18265 [Hyphomicrobium sp.]